MQRGVLGSPYVAARARCTAQLLRGAVCWAPQRPYSVLTQHLVLVPAAQSRSAEEGGPPGLTGAQSVSPLHPELGSQDCSLRNAMTDSTCGPSMEVKFQL